MNNAKKFQEVFGYYATEMWTKPEKEFLDWINAEYNTTIKTNERTGRWIDDDPYHHKYHRCSCCGTGYFNWGSDNYCKNCGTRMEGNEE